MSFQPKVVSAPALPPAAAMLPIAAPMPVICIRYNDFGLPDPQDLGFAGIHLLPRVDRQAIFQQLRPEIRTHRCLRVGAWCGECELTCVNVRQVMSDDLARSVADTLPRCLAASDAELIRMFTEHSEGSDLIARGDSLARSKCSRVRALATGYLLYWSIAGMSRSSGHGLAREAWHALVANFLGETARLCEPKLVEDLARELKAAHIISGHDLMRSTALLVQAVTEESAARARRHERRAEQRRQRRRRRR